MRPAVIPVTRQRLLLTALTVAAAGSFATVLLGVAIVIFVVLTFFSVTCAVVGGACSAALADVPAALVCAMASCRKAARHRSAMSLVIR